MISYLNTDNIAHSTPETELHPLKPCIDEETKLLFLGSFPPQRKKWAKNFDFFYPNFINDHWRIMGLIFHKDKDYFVNPTDKTFKYAEIINFVKQHGIGYYDTCEAVRRLKQNASDKYLEVIRQTDIKTLLSKAPKCRYIVTTGQKATETLCQLLNITSIPKVGEQITLPLTNNDNMNISLHRLPSSSRAYPMSLENKAALYSQILDKL